MESSLPGRVVHKAQSTVKNSLAVLDSKVFRRRIKQFLFLAIVAGLGYWLWGLLESSGLTERAVEFIRIYSHSNRLLAYAFFVGLATVSVLLGPFTSAPVVPVVLLLWGKSTTLALLVVGWLLGGMGAYAVGKYLGYPVVSKILSKSRADTWRDLVAHRMTFAWALLFRLSMPAETGYVFGLAKYHFWKFLAATFLVELATGALLVWGGDALVSRDIRQFTAWLAAGIIMFAGAAYLLRKKFQTS